MTDDLDDFLSGFDAPPRPRYSADYVRGWHDAFNRAIALAGGWRCGWCARTEQEDIDQYLLAALKNVRDVIVVETKGERK